ncbi:SDR family NAD(P)-dependent oxidoreductase [Kitasatospora sp. NPDC092286]|uniref:SDR family NAD(P)-dependent oxidoreductase n=1 Tax=Kitasatospora sp. NPDC092286 TaxID=3364087 RepID=UPI0037FB49BF
MSEPRVCLFLGAGGRLGGAFLRSLSSRYRIAAVYRTCPAGAERRYEQVVDPLNQAPPVHERHTTFYPIAADLADPGSPGRIAELALAAFGRVDLVVNSAVLYDWGPGTSLDFLERLPRQFLVNVVRPLQVVAELYEKSWRAIPEDNRLHRRNVINLSSVAASRAFPGTGQLGYSACKAALDIASRHLAAELAPAGVRVNVVAPNTFPRIVSVERVLAALYELDAGSETGQVRVIDREPRRVRDEKSVPIRR